MLVLSSWLTQNPKSCTGHGLFSVQIFFGQRNWRLVLRHPPFFDSLDPCEGLLFALFQDRNSPNPTSFLCPSHFVLRYLVNYGEFLTKKSTDTSPTSIVPKFSFGCPDAICCCWSWSGNLKKKGATKVKIFQKQLGNKIQKQKKGKHRNNLELLVRNLEVKKTLPKRYNVFIWWKDPKRNHMKQRQQKADHDLCSWIIRWSCRVDSCCRSISSSNLESGLTKIIQETWICFPKWWFL